MSADIRQYINIISEAAQAAEYRDYKLGQAVAELQGDDFGPPSFFKEIGWALDNICGDFLGEGAVRQAWSHRTDPAQVVKVELFGQRRRKHAADNRREAEVWNLVRGTPLQRWFAPVVWHSKNYWTIIQQRAAQDDGRLPAHRLPAEVPRLFLDSFDTEYLRNWGVIDNQAVILDYSSMNWPMLRRGVDGNIAMVPVDVRDGRIVPTEEADSW